MCQEFPLDDGGVSGEFSARASVAFMGGKEGVLMPRSHTDPGLPRLLE
jgi:hypothetical protein